MSKVSINSYSDIINGEAYVCEPNTLNLVLFSDGVTYNKSAARSMWNTFASIVELPPNLRNAVENILFISYWSGSDPDFNVYFEKYNKQIDLILNRGIYYKDKKFKIKIHAFLGDAPARSKVI